MKPRIYEFEDMQKAKKKLRETQSVAAYYTIHDELCEWLFADFYAMAIKHDAQSKESFVERWIQRVNDWEDYLEAEA